MAKSSALNVGAGTFVLLGFAALAFLTTQTTSHGVHFGRVGHFYTVTAEFDNVGDLKVGAPVSMSGVDIGRVTRIDLDTKAFRALVALQLNSKYNKIPSDSDASIFTQGLLGGKFVGSALQIAMSEERNAQRRTQTWGLRTGIKQAPVESCGLVESSLLLQRFREQRSSKR